MWGGLRGSERSDCLVCNYDHSVDTIVDAARTSAGATQSGQIVEFAGAVAQRVDFDSGAVE